MQEVPQGPSFLECREHFVRVPTHIVQRVPKEVIDIQPRVFTILASKKDLKISMLRSASCSFSLPMVVHTSPMIALLRSNPAAQEDEWRPRYVPFSDSYAELGQLLTATVGGMYGEGIVSEENAHEILQQFLLEGERQQDQIVQDLSAIATSTQLQEQERMSQFLCRLEIATIDLLNRYETLLHKCLIRDENVPLALCLTPKVYPSVDALGENPERCDTFWERFTQYWQSKVDNTNEKLELDSKVQPQQWITIEGLRQAHTQIPAEQLWRGYLTPKTATEYMHYFTKVNDI